MGELKRYFILWLAMCLGVLADLFFTQKGFSENNGLSFNAYYTSWALVYFLILLFLYLVIKNKIVTLSSDFTPIVALCLSVNKLYDETLGNPTKLQLNELFFTIAIVSFALYRQRRIKRITNRANEVATNDSSGINSRNT